MKIKGQNTLQLIISPFQMKSQAAAAGKRQCAREVSRKNLTAPPL
jgi:hypothetical protein